MFSKSANPLDLRQKSTIRALFKANSVDLKTYWRSGESARLPPMCPGFDSRTRRHMWVEFVVGSLLCSERFSPGTSVFPSPQKPAFLNSNSIWTSGTLVMHEPLARVIAQALPVLDVKFTFTPPPPPALSIMHTFSCFLYKVLFFDPSSSLPRLRATRTGLITSNVNSHSKPLSSVPPQKEPFKLQTRNFPSKYPPLHKKMLMNLYFDLALRERCSFLQF